MTVLAKKNLEVAYVLTSRACERSGKRSGAGRKSGERERSGERTFRKTLERERSMEWEAAERRAGVTEIDLSTERQIVRSRSTHMLCFASQPLRGFLGSLLITHRQPLCPVLILLFAPRGV